MKPERNYSVEETPFEENLERFAPSYTPEVFTDEEKKYLDPFFTNLDKPIFITHGLPEEVNAALNSRYSRSKLSKRRLFLNEYVNPIIHPESQKDWEKSSYEEKEKALDTRERFIAIVDLLNEKGGLDYVVNIQRARKFFDVWLTGFGDDSIAEEGNAQVSIEGVSSLVLEEIVSKRIGVSPIVKSTRFVSFEERRPDGEFQYQIPGEIKGTEFEAEYKRIMDRLFTLYSSVSEPYLEYIKEKYPKGNDESDSSFLKSRRSKRFDDIRDLLPFSTQNNMGINGNGRALEDLANRLLASRVGEARWWGKELSIELSKVIPSLVSRTQTKRGAELQLYRRNINALRDEMAEEILEGVKSPTMSRWVKIVSSTPQADVEIISAYIFASNKRRSLEQIRNRVSEMSAEERSAYIGRILEERKFGKEKAERQSDRFKKVPRAFENAKYFAELWGRGGDERDIHRHRMGQEEHAPYTTYWGVDLEQEVKESPFIDEIMEVLHDADYLYADLAEEFGTDVAQYAVPFAFIQHWYMNLTAREIYWMEELRTGPQGRPHYKEILLDLVDQAIARDPGVFQGVLADRNDYRLARRESEKRNEEKLKRLNGKKSTIG